MSSTLVNKEKNLLELTVEVSAEKLQHAMQETYKKNAARYSVPGFRKGKAPYAMVARHYGEGSFYEGAIDLLATEVYREALAEHQIEPAARPTMDVLEISSKTGMKLQFLVTTKPEVKLGLYKGVEVEKEEVQVSEEEVEKELKAIQNKNARILEVDDAEAVTAMGDIANINFDGSVDGVAFNGGKAENHELELGSGAFIPGFEEQVCGRKVGESFDVKVTFPENYGVEELKGKEAIFACRLNGIKRKEVPALDDEFAVEVSEFDTLAEYKKSIEKKLLEKKEKRATEAFEDAVIEAVVKNAELEIPEVMVKEEVDRIIGEQVQMMRYQGIELQQYLQYIGRTLEEFKKGYEPQAVKNLEARLVLEAVKKAEAFEVSEEDMAKEYEDLANQYKRTAEEIKKIFEGQEEYIRENLLTKKAVRLVVDQAKAKVK